jgi:hypothetical protein
MFSEHLWCKNSAYFIPYADFTNNIFEELQGKYLLRLEINWNHEQLLHSGNLVVYSSNKNVGLIQIKNSKFKVI